MGKLGQLLAGLGIAAAGIGGVALLVKSRKAKGGSFGGCGELGKVDDWAATKDATVERVKGQMGPGRSQLFTWTTKVHAPSWSLPAVLSCPGVFCHIQAGHPEDIPKKCLGCYAYNSGKYGTPGVKQAMRRRMVWFDHGGTEDEIAWNLKRALSTGGKDHCQARWAKPYTPWSCKTAKGKKSCSREDAVTCKRDASGYPTRVRLFDSGDFHDARAVRIWTQVAKSMPGTKFWAPTTAWHGAIHHPDIIEALGELAALPNVAVRPSGLELDKPAPQKKFGRATTSGSTVVAWEKVKAQPTECPWTKPVEKGKTCAKDLRKLGATDASGKPIVYDPADDTTLPKWGYIEGVRHFLCRGDCGKCWACWGKHNRIAYIQHGPDTKSAERAAARGKEMEKDVLRFFPQEKDIGPGGVKGGTASKPGARLLEDPELVRQLAYEAKKRAETKARKAAEKAAAGGKA